MLDFVLLTSLGILIFVAFVFVASLTELSTSRFRKKWPEISDDEFLSRCPPGTNREVALRVRAIVAEQLGVPYANVYPEQSFVNDLGCG